MSSTAGTRMQSGGGNGSAKSSTLPPKTSARRFNYFVFLFFTSCVLLSFVSFWLFVAADLVFREKPQISEIESYPNLLSRALTTAHSRSVGAALREFFIIIPTPVTLLATTGIFFLVPLTHFVGGYVHYKSEWNPSQGGLRFIILQAFSWSLFLAAITLPWVPSGLQHLFPLTYSYDGVNTVAGTAALVSEVLMVSSLFIFSGKTDTKLTTEEDASIPASPSKRKKLLMKKRRSSLIGVLSLPTVDGSNERKARTSPLSASFSWWFLFIVLNVILALVAMFLSVISEIILVHNKAGFIMNLDFSTVTKATGIAMIAMLSIGVFLTHGIGGHALHGTKSGWNFVMPFQGGALFVALQMMAWTSFALAILLTLLRLTIGFDVEGNMITNMTQASSGKDLNIARVIPFLAQIVSVVEQVWPQLGIFLQNLLTVSVFQMRLSSIVAGCAGVASQVLLAASLFVYRPPSGSYTRGKKGYDTTYLWIATSTDAHAVLWRDFFATIGFPLIIGLNTVIIASVVYMTGIRGTFKGDSQGQTNSQTVYLLILQTFRPFIPMFDKSFGSIKVLYHEYIAPALSFGVILGLLVMLSLLLFRSYVRASEPTWVQNIPIVGEKTFRQFFTGTTVDSVKTGYVCRKYMDPKYPSLLRFSNGVAGGFIRDFILCKDAEIAKAILQEPDTKKPEKGYRVFRRLHGYKGGRDFLSFRSHKDDGYKRNRSVAYRALMERAVEHFDDIFVPCVHEYIEKFPHGSSDDVAQGVRVVEQMHYVATALLTRIAFDVNDSTLDKNLFESAVWMVGDMLKRPENNSLTFLDLLPTERNYKLHQAQSCLRQTILTIIEQKRERARRRKAYLAEGGDPADFPEGNDVVSKLIKDPKNSDKDLIGILGIFFFAGFDTTANTMSMVLYHLAVNTDVQTKVREEVRRVMGSNSVDIPDQNSIWSLNYLKCVIMEVLRMFPTVPMVTREVTENHHHLGVCPRFKEKDTFGVAINFFGLHYNEKGYNRPHEFLPERWMDSSIDKEKDPNERVFCPFAMGKRACLGRQFAFIEMLTVISSIVQRYEVRTIDFGSNEEHPDDVRYPNIVEGGTLLVKDTFRLVFEPLREKDPSTGEWVSRMKATESQKRLAKLQKYTLEDVAKHHTRGDLWMVIDEKVYDLTEFARKNPKTGREKHPGGGAILEAMAGTDATNEFDFVGHTQFAHRLMDKYLIGKLSGRTKAQKTYDDEMSPRLMQYFSKTPMRENPTPQISLGKLRRRSSMFNRLPGLRHRSTVEVGGDDWHVKMKENQLEDVEAEVNWEQLMKVSEK